jgi:hypothetical protein
MPNITGFDVVLGGESVAPPAVLPCLAEIKVHCVHRDPDETMRAAMWGCAVDTGGQY